MLYCKTAHNTCCFEGVPCSLGVRHQVHHRAHHLAHATVRAWFLPQPPTRHAPCSSCSMQATPHPEHHSVYGITLVQAKVLSDLRQHWDQGAAHHVVQAHSKAVQTGLFCQSFHGSRPHTCPRACGCLAKLPSQYCTGQRDTRPRKVGACPHQVRTCLPRDAWHWIRQ
jgi:hypothetical protein